MKSSATLLKTSERLRRRDIGRGNRTVSITNTSESVAKDGAREVVWPFDQIVGVAAHGPEPIGADERLARMDMLVDTGAFCPSPRKGSIQKVM